MAIKRVAIVGAGVSGLAACKHALERGFSPVVFEADTVLGGVWAHTPATTLLQTPRPMYQFSDYPWPESVTDMNPNSRKVLEYLRSYAEHFGVLERIRFGHRVLAMEYVGVPESKVMAWEEWSGCGEAFGLGNGEWRLTVENVSNAYTETHSFDFVILCVGRFSGIPNIPTFPEGAGPEVFDGTVIHSKDYAMMGPAKAAQLVAGKRVVVVGFLKSALDVAAECAEANGVENPCTMILRTKQWTIPDFFVRGHHIALFYLNRFAELLFHKPGEGFLLALIATILTPLRWMISKYVGSYYARPLKKYGIEPETSFFDSLAACVLSITPKNFFDKVEEGSIVLKKADSFCFCRDGVLLDGESAPLKCDLVIFGTGYKGDDNIRSVFTSPHFQTIVAGSANTTVQLYRECIPPRVPQVAVLGYSESLSNLYTTEIRAKWVVSFLAGDFRLPSIRQMEADVMEWEKYMRRYSGGYYRRSSVAAVNIWHNDHLCRDMGVNPRRKKGFLAELFEPYGPADYAGVGSKAAKD